MAEGSATPGKVAFELVSPERLLASEEVDMVVCPGDAGDFRRAARAQPADVAASARHHRGL